MTGFLLRSLLLHLGSTSVRNSSRVSAMARQIASSSLDTHVLPQGFAGFGAPAAQAEGQQEDAINAFISSARGGGPEPPAAQEDPPSAAAIRPVGGATSRGQGAVVTLRSVAEANRCPLVVVEAFLAALGAELDDGLVDFMYCSAEDLAAAVSVFTVDGNHSSAMQRGQATRFIAAVHQLSCYDWAALVAHWIAYSSCALRHMLELKMSRKFGKHATNMEKQVLAPLYRVDR